MTYDPTNQPDPKVFLAKAKYFFAAYRHEALLAAVVLMVAGVTFYYMLINPVDISSVFAKQDAMDPRTGMPLKMEPTTLYVNELHRRLTATRKQLTTLKSTVSKEWKVDSTQPSSTWVSSSRPLLEMVSQEPSAATAWANVATALIVVPERLRDADDALARWSQRPRGIPKADLDELKRVLDAIDLQLRTADESVQHLRKLGKAIKFEQVVHQ